MTWKGTTTASVHLHFCLFESINAKPPVAKSLSKLPFLGQKCCQHRAFLQNFWAIHSSINDEVCLKNVALLAHTSTTVAIGQANSQFVAALA
jgi:hypothetical protein